MSKQLTEIFVVVAFAFYILWRLVRLAMDMRLSRNNKFEQPIISSHQMLNGGRLHSVHKGEMEGFKYNLLSNSAGRVMVLVNLKHNTKLHLVAIGDKSNIEPMIKAQISSHFLEKVVLEGDFPSYFQVFASPGKHIEVRQIMEPRNMAQFVDFCRAYNVEIFHGSLYISLASGANDDEDPTTMTHDLQTFLRKNSRMLQRL